MNITKTFLRVALILGIVCGGFALPVARAADSDASIPTIIQNGFKSWAAKDASYAFDIWKMGGLLENDSKPAKLAGYFARMDRTLGKCISCELIESKRIGDSSRTVYMSINFEHAAVYARFLMYRPTKDKDLVVQDMDFSPKPEAIMPWLSFAGQDYGQ